MGFSFESKAMYPLRHGDLCEFAHGVLRHDSYACNVISHGLLRVKLPGIEVFNNQLHRASIQLSQRIA